MIGLYDIVKLYISNKIGNVSSIFYKVVYFYWCDNIERKKNHTTYILTEQIKKVIFLIKFYLMFF